jgi:predicted nucleic acid-binding protein
MVLIDANIIIDILTDDPDWADASEDALLRAAANDPVAINPLIYAEVSAAFSTPEKLEESLNSLEFVRLELPYRAAFLAAKAFLQYRRRGGEKRSPLPDFYIGAHAQTEGIPLLTRDLRRYRTYFPKLRLLQP